MYILKSCTETTLSLESSELCTEVQMFLYFFFLLQTYLVILFVFQGLSIMAQPLSLLLCPIIQVRDHWTVHSIVHNKALNCYKLIMLPRISDVGSDMWCCVYLCMCNSTCHQKTYVLHILVVYVDSEHVVDSWWSKIREDRH